MIPIDISQLNLPPGWRDKAKKLTDDLEKIPDATERSKFLTKHSDTWQVLKGEMERISHNKCWYCEAVNIRGDLHVDHYRPKSIVKNKDGTEAGGYFWLAFDYTNFRLACSYCNSLHSGSDKQSRGKAAQFPLYREGDRATTLASHLKDELPFLLDPTNPSDPALLWFADDGTAIACKDLELGGFLCERVRISIEILNLNEVKIRKLE